MLYTVLGGGGFIGRRLVQALRGSGADVYAPARGDPGLWQRDLGRVFYCIGLTADFARRPTETIEAHAMLLSRLIDTGRIERLVYLSSTRLYDSLDARVGNGESLLRIDPANARSLYDLTKALGENLCLTRLKDRASVARLSGVFDWEAGSPGFLSEWFARAAAERAFTLDSASGLVRDYIHLDDAVAALRAMMDKEAQGIVNVASGENVSNGEIAEVFNSRGWAVSFAREGKRQTLPVCDISALAALGVSPMPVRDVVEHWIGKVHRP